MKILVVSVGGGGMNALNYIIDSGLTGAEFISCNSFEWELEQSKADKKIWLDDKLIHGLDGALPERSEKAAIETREEILSAFRGADAVIIVAGLGGCDGTGASPIIAQFAKEIGALTVAVITLPFFFEGPRRNSRAEGALKKLSAQADAVIKIRNDKFLQDIDPKTPITSLFKFADEIICHTVRTLISVFQIPFVINSPDKKIRRSTE